MPNSTRSFRSKSSNHSSRAVTILEQIKNQTSPRVYKDFLNEMSLFREQKIDAADLQRRINNILIDYPMLLKQFQTSLPSTPNQKFKSALLFVNKVKEAYVSEPEVYQEFLNFMKEFQRGGFERDYVL
jgi:histone deacetylase complex regulatory component SIN3